MRKSTKSAVAITLAIAGAIASPFSSNAAEVNLKDNFSFLGNATLNLVRIELKGHVVKVADGGTIRIFDVVGEHHKIRLHGIDVLEKSQVFGQKSRAYLASLVREKNVTVVYMSKDRYGRVLGTVITLA